MDPEPPMPAARMVGVLSARRIANDDAVRARGLTSTVLGLGAR
jgi:hypothetical protein